MLYDVKGNKDLAYEYYDKVISMKNFQNSRADAENLKKTGYWLNYVVRICVNIQHWIVCEKSLSCIS